LGYPRLLSRNPYRDRRSSKAPTLFSAMPKAPDRVAVEEFYDVLDIPFFKGVLSLFPKDLVHAHQKAQVSLGLVLLFHEHLLPI